MSAFLNVFHAQPQNLTMVQLLALRFGSKLISPSFDQSRLGFSGIFIFVSILSQGVQAHPSGIVSPPPIREYTVLILKQTVSPHKTGNFHPRIQEKSTRLTCTKVSGKVFSIPQFPPAHFTGPLPHTPGPLSPTGVCLPGDKARADGQMVTLALAYSHRAHMGIIVLLAPWTLSPSPQRE